MFNCWTHHSRDNENTISEIKLGNKMNYEQYEKYLAIFRDTILKKNSVMTQLTVTNILNHDIRYLPDTRILTRRSSNSGRGEHLFILFIIP